MSAEPQQARPTSQDVARRLVILKHVAVCAIVSPPREMLEMLRERWGADEWQSFAADAQTRRETFWQRVREARLWPQLSPTELKLAQTTMVTMSHQQQVDASWRLESAQVLMWALGLIGELPAYDTRAEHDLLKQIPADDISGFVSSAHLRTTAEIDQARDDAELWHWRSRTRQLIEEGQVLSADNKFKAAGITSFDDVVLFTAGKLAEEGRIPTIADDFAARGKAYRKLSDEEWSEVRSITIERHFALNWLCGFAPNNEWDRTPTGT